MDLDCDALGDRRERAVREFMTFIAGRWPLWILHVLATASAPVRFSRLQQEVEGVSQKMLTQSLRRMERAGLVTRTLYPEVPPRVEYAATPLGRALLEEIAPVWRWVAARIDMLEPS